MAAATPTVPTDASWSAITYVPSIQQWKQACAPSIEIITAGSLLDRLYDCKYLRDSVNDNFARTDVKQRLAKSIAKYLATMCGDVSRDYTFDHTRDALVGHIEGEIPEISWDENHMVLGVDLRELLEVCNMSAAVDTGAANPFTRALPSLTHILNRVVYGYLVWGYKRVCNGDDVSENAAILKVYCARASAHGAYVDKKTSTQVPFNSIEQGARTYTINGKTRVYKSRVAQVRRSVVGVGDLLLCCWLLWLQKSIAIDMVLLEVVEKTGDSYGQWREGSLPLAHRYMQYGFVEIPALTQHMHLFGPSYQTGLMPSMVCSIRAIQSDAWCATLTAGPRNRECQVFSTFDDYWTSLPARLAHDIEKIPDEKERARSLYNAHLASITRIKEQEHAQEQARHRSPSARIRKRKAVHDDDSLRDETILQLA